MNENTIRRATVLATAATLLVAMVSVPVSANSYEVVTGSFTWAEARDAAANAGGECPHLATITSATEQADTYAQFGNDMAFAWLGGQKVDGDWQWVTGEAWNYTNWQDGEPSGDGNKVQVGGGGSGSPWVYDGKWNDALGTYQTSYIVEYGCPNCKDGGWEAYGFRNQGQCIRFVNTGKDSRLD